MKRAEQTLDSTDLYAEQESRDLQLSQVSGLWFQDCVVSGLCGFSTVWFQHCVVSALCGFSTVWFQHCVVAYRR